jgi:hypothetical protein
MSFSLLTHTIKQSANGTNVTTDAIDTTGAKLLVAITCDNSSGQAPTDNKSNTWYSFTSQTNVGITRIHVALGSTLNVGTGHTFTKSAGAPAIAILAFGATGIISWQTVNTQSGASSGGATSLQPGSLTPIVNNELIVMGMGDDWGSGLAVDVGTLLDSAILVPGVAFGIASAYEIQITATARNPTWSWTGSKRVQTVMGLFREVDANLSPTVFDPETANAGGTLSNGNLTWTSNSSAGDQSVYSSTYKTAGKWYLECSHANVGNNNSRIGLSGPLGVQQINDMFRNQGDHGVSGMATDLAIDLDNMKCWGRNGTGNWNGNASADPASNTLGFSLTPALAGSCFFYVDSASDSANPTWTVNFGATAFARTVPSGFTAWDAGSAAANKQSAVTMM